MSAGRQSRTSSRKLESFLRSAISYAAVIFLFGCSFLAAQAPSEYEVKAAFLLNFTKFVQWPEGAFARPDSPLTICVLGEDPFGNGLDRSIAGEVVNGRKLAVQRLRRAPSPGSCQVLFISRSEKDVPDLIAGLGTAVLTVSDRNGFLHEGGMISFVIENRHVRFDINQGAVVKGSLIMSARMLSVARIVQK